MEQFKAQKLTFTTHLTKKPPTLPPPPPPPNKIYQ
jgi:hypothetical protein